MNSDALVSKLHRQFQGQGELGGSTKNGGSKKKRMIKKYTDGGSSYKS
jgi:hypothetical protein